MPYFAVRHFCIWRITNLFCNVTGQGKFAGQRPAFYHCATLFGMQSVFHYILCMKAKRPWRGCQVGRESRCRTWVLTACWRWQLSGRCTQHSGSVELVPRHQLLKLTHQSSTADSLHCVVMQPPCHIIIIIIIMATSQLNMVTKGYALSQ